MPYKWYQILGYCGSAGRDRGRNTSNYTHIHIEGDSRMTALAIRTATWVGLPGIANWFKNLNQKLKQRRLERQTFNELSSLSDRDLQDLGISRTDIRSISNGNFYKDEMEYIKSKVEVNQNLKGWV